MGVGCATLRLWIDKEVHLQMCQLVETPWFDSLNLSIASGGARSSPQMCLVGRGRADNTR